MEIIFREDVLAIGERYGLGTFVRSHQGSTLAATMRKIGGTSISTLLFLILLMLAYLISKDTTHILAYPLSYFLWPLVKICLPIWALLMVILIYTQNRKRNYLYEFTGGIIEVKKKKVIHIVP